MGKSGLEPESDLWINSVFKYLYLEHCVREWLSGVSSWILKSELDFLGTG